LTVAQRREGGNRLLDRTREHHVGAERRLEVGEPAETLARIASEEAAALIVVGSRRRRWRRQLRSRLAAELAATAPCPVVVVPPAERR
jgi:nucleotide-binding universal stress UspA family protein